MQTNLMDQMGKYKVIHVALFVSQNFYPRSMSLANPDDETIGDIRAPLGDATPLRSVN